MNFGFEPVFDKNSRVLILGSFPSVKSRAQGFYYGNKQNRFWKVLGKIFNEEIEDDIQCKKEFLLKHEIALFDIVCESDLAGSMDFDLKKSDLKISDISFLLPPNTKVKKILCNGKTSFELTKQSVKTDLPIVCLPSTSPANVRFDIHEWEKHLT